MNLEGPNDFSAPNSSAVSRYRWVICALLFAATAINYIDRQILGLLAIPLQRDLGWSESQYGLIITGFQFAYASGLLVFAADRLDWVVSYEGKLLQLERQSRHHAPAKSKVLVRENQAGELHIEYRGQRLGCTRIERRPPPLTTIPGSRDTSRCLPQR